MIPLDEKLNKDKELEIYNWRKYTNHPLVHCYGADGVDS